MKSIKLYLSHYKNIRKCIGNLGNKRKTLLYTRIPFFSLINNESFKTVVWWCVSLCEPLISIFVATMLLPVYFVKALITKKKPIGKHLGMVEGHFLHDRSIAAGIYDDIEDWVYPLFCNESLKKDDNKRNHIVFEYVTIIDVFICYLKTIITVFLSIPQNRFRFIFRNYVSFEFYLFWKYLNNIPKDTTLYYVSQVDRWAVLCDNAPQEKKVLLQHGIENPTADWPIKISHTQLVYAFTPTEAKHLLHACFSINPEIRYYSPTIALTPFNKSNKPSLLIVAFPDYDKYNEEEYIIKSLYNDVDIYLKLHPGKNQTTLYEKLQVKYPYNIIREQLFPDVDVVVSYRSTLGVEYEIHKKKVFYYEECSISDVVRNIKFYLEHNDKV